MKKLFALLTILTFSIVLSACGGTDLDYTKGEFTSPYCDPLDAATDVENIAVGMATDSGTIDDKSFNQGTWEGIRCYNAKHDSAIKYVKPNGETKEDYINAIDNLVDSGYKLIVTPGYKFEEAVYASQSTHEDIKFVLIDGAPHKGDFVPEIKANTVSIMFAEEQAGFLAGVSAALQTQTGKLAFIGGMEIPAVQKFGYGYVAGVAYANENLGTNAEVTQYVYQGTFDNVQAGQTLANGMYEAGIDIIFAAAGGVGVGVINEAKTRAEDGENVFVVGVDVDQYAAGVYGSEGKSVILTSAMKRIDLAAYNYLVDFAKGQFKGAQQVTYNIKNNGVGIPANNPNLDADTVTEVNNVIADMKADTIIVPKLGTELETYLTARGYTTPSGVKYYTPAE
jgi:basic membrane protein A and related proteins